MKTLQLGLPITSRQPFDADRLFEVFARSFAATASERMNYLIYLGIDDTDEYYHPRMYETAQRLQEETGATVHPIELRGMSGRICSIWQSLAMAGHQHGADYFLFAGDDLEFLTPDWDEKLCGPLDRRGYGIEAFYDEAFPNFPTFPIFHRSHIDCFGRVFPGSFDRANQYGDPFLFQLYQSVDAAGLQRDVRCNNTIGGAKPARYDKRQPDAVPLGEWGGKLRTFIANTSVSIL